MTPRETSLRIRKRAAIAGRVLAAAVILSCLSARAEEIPLRPPPKPIQEVINDAIRNTLEKNKIPVRPNVKPPLKPPDGHSKEPNVSYCCSRGHEGPKDTTCKISIDAEAPPNANPETAHLGTLCEQKIDQPCKGSGPTPPGGGQPAPVPPAPPVPDGGGGGGGGGNPLGQMLPALMQALAAKGQQGQQGQQQGQSNYSDEEIMQMARAAQTAIAQATAAAQATAQATVTAQATAQATITAQATGTLPAGDAATTSSSGLASGARF